MQLENHTEMEHVLSRAAVEDLQQLVLQVELEDPQEPSGAFVGPSPPPWSGWVLRQS